MFVELLSNIFPLFINNVFQSYKIILEYFSHTYMSIIAGTCALVLGEVQSGR
jgi:hypothetical protein